MPRLNWRAGRARVVQYDTHQWLPLARRLRSPSARVARQASSLEILGETARRACDDLLSEGRALTLDEAVDAAVRLWPPA